jgi:hypothetical protein
MRHTRARRWKNKTTPSLISVKCSSEISTKGVPRVLSQSSRRTASCACRDGPLFVSCVHAWWGCLLAAALPYPVVVLGQHRLIISTALFVPSCVKNACAMAGLCVAAALLCVPCSDFIPPHTHSHPHTPTRTHTRHPKVQHILQQQHGPASAHGRAPRG